MHFDENKLISLMENFSGAKFQWIKTNRPELLGKVVICRTIEPRGDKFFAVFDDGSSVETSQLNTSLLMLHGDMQPLSRAEVESISGPRPQAAQTVAASQPRRAAVNDQITDSVTQAAPSNTNMFEMFNSEESQIDLKISIKLPEKDFLRMMYVNAKDKEKFLNELSDYVFRVINKKVVQESISAIVVPQETPKRSSNAPIVNITEIHED